MQKNVDVQMLRKQDCPNTVQHDENMDVNMLV